MLYNGFNKIFKNEPLRPSRGRVSPTAKILSSASIPTDRAAGHYSRQNKKGISVIELLIVIVIISIGLVALLNAVTSSLKISRLMKENDQAKELTQEALEAVRSFRDGTDWDTDGLGTLTLDISYHPEKTSDIPPKWNLVSGEEIIGIFTRKVVFESVSRDLNDDITSSGTADLNTKKVTATVSWVTSWGDRQVEISTYLTNWR